MTIQLFYHHSLLLLETKLVTVNVILPRTSEFANEAGLLL